MLYFDPVYFVIVAPAILLGLWAQWRVHATYAQAMREPARLTGFEAAQRILDDAGLRDVSIEEVPGHLSDHYDPQHRVVRLSSEVCHSRSLAAVGIAAHEVGHALQHAYGYAPLALRSLAVPAAVAGSNFSLLLLIIGAVLTSKPLVLAGLLLFAGVVVFQIVNLPVEFDASRRAKAMLYQLGIVDDQQAVMVSRVLDAAALTYVAATLQAILTLIYYVMRYGWVLNRSDD
ncbi:MAG: zinc metallopeptidase [Planctomycetaceae bacterium]|nr:MAG: zinc metallopeptidase [Planctomycetaceae bacterium]